MRKKILSSFMSMLLVILIAVFTAVPGFAIGGGLGRFNVLSAQSRQLIGDVLGNTAEQFRTGFASSEEITALFAGLPVLPTDFAAIQQDVGDFLQSAWRGGARNAEIALKQTAEEGIYQLGLLYDDLLHRQKQVFDFLGIIEYNAETGFFQGQDGRGVFSIGFDYDSSQYMVRSSEQSWLRALGYNQLYDTLAPLAGVTIDTLRFPFAYKGEEWMVQMWKGNYFTFFHGAEVGLYQRPAARRLNHYDGAALDLPLSLRVYSGGNLLFSTGAHNSWWMAGFQYGNPQVNIVPANALRVEGTIIFPEKGMLDAFYAVFDAQKDEGITGRTEGTAFHFVWRETTQ